MTSHKPIVAVFDEHSAYMSKAVLVSSISRACLSFSQWGLDGDLRQWGAEPPTAAAIVKALTERPLLWTRMRRCRCRSLFRTLVKSPRLPKRGCTRRAASIKFSWSFLLEQRFHIYASPHNPGALELTRELWLEARGDDVSNLASCRHMLLYLDARTWTGDDDRRDKLKREVLKAMSIRSVPLLLAHEDGPFEYQPATAQRHGILFDELIHGVDGGTHAS